MYIGQEFPIRIQVLSEPPIDLLAAGTSVFIRVTNNKRVKFTFGQGQVDGIVSIEQDDDNNNTWAVAAGLTRAQSKQLVSGRIIIEVLLKTPDADFPAGFHTVGQFIEPVEESFTSDITT